MYFAHDKDNSTSYEGNTLQELLKDIEENHYDGVQGIPYLDFYTATKITVKYESKLVQVTPTAVKKPVAKKIGGKR